MKPGEDGESSKIAKVREYDSYWSDLEKQRAAVLAACANYLTETKNCWQRFAEELSPEALDAWIRSAVKQEYAQQAAHFTARQLDWAARRFREQCRDWRKVLADAANERLADAEKTLKSIIAEETQHLAKHGLESEIDEIPRVKRAVDRRAEAERLAGEIRDGDEKSLWQMVVPQLCRE